MLDLDSFENALKQRYSNSRKPAVRNVKLKIIDPKKEAEKKRKKDTETLEKMEFFRSKKAKEGMPEAIRQERLKALRKKLKSKS